MFAPHSKILIVDDYVALRKVIKKMLKDLGYTNVEEADDGKLGLQKLQEAAAAGQNFQLVISDWNMPKMSGLSLLKNCKADPSLRDIPFMLVTAELSESSIAEAAKLGVSDYVIKPFTAQTLTEKLERIYTRHFTAKAS